MRLEDVQKDCPTRPQREFSDSSYLSQGEWPRLPFTARIERPAASNRSIQARSLLLQGWGLIDLPLRATFSPAHPLADIFHPPCPPIASQSISRGRATSPSEGLLIPQLPRGSRQIVLYCAHRTSTFLSCAFCEQEERSACSLESFRGRALREHRRSSGSIPSSVLRARRAPGRSPLPFSTSSLPAAGHVVN
jgi:hypothetical protein